MKNPFLLIFFSFVLFSFLVSCIGGDAGPSRSKITANVETSTGSWGDTSSDTSSDTKNIIPVVELRQIVDPYTGSFKAKVSIQKNFNGYLYLSGINISTLKNKFVKVRFKFGRDLSSVTLPASIGKAEGLTGQTSIQVLIIDMKQRPFENIRLLYDLYDYNKYTSTSTITNDPYDDEVFCRGLDLKYDPTFLPYGNKCALGSSSCTYSVQECDHPLDECFYAYAKIKDAGLYDSNGYSTIPTTPQVDVSKVDFDTSDTDSASTVNEKNAENLKKCLPDNGVLNYKTTAAYRRLTYDGTGNVAGIGQAVMTLLSDIGTKSYTYNGPYRVISKNNWVLREGAAIGSNGLFEKTIPGYTTVEKGTKSFLFPRSAKLDLQENVKHLSSTTPWVTGLRSIDSLFAAGTTDWMDGCNLRMINYDSSTNEGIQSCNVSATIEILATNTETQQDEVVSTSSNLKLQLLRSSNKNFDGDETLYQSMKSCSSSRQCGSNECCYNNRCWSKGLVAQCIEDVSSEGGFKIGDSCSSDYQCLSLCCDSSLGRCAVHDSNIEPPVLCSKSPGEFCVAEEWCRKDPVRVCKIIKTGVDVSTGKTTCALRCYNQMQNGKCLNGVCVSPETPAIPSFDPANPDCTNAQAAPLNL